MKNNPILEKIRDIVWEIVGPKFAQLQNDLHSLEKEIYDLHVYNLDTLEAMEPKKSADINEAINDLDDRVAALEKSLIDFGDNLRKL